MIGTGKAVTFFLIAMVSVGLFMGVLSGGGGVAATTSTADVSANATEIPVVSTNGFLDSDYIYMGDETIMYTSRNSTCFLTCTRGYSGTAATNHTAGRAVYTGEVSSINQALGFNIGQIVTSVGPLSIIVIPFKFLTVTIPRMIAQSVAFLSGSLGKAVLGVLWMCLIAAFIINLALVLTQVISSAASFFMGLIRRPA